MNIVNQDVDWSLTYHKNKSTQELINKAVSHNLRIISKEIIQRVPDLISIYLTGGYAASEGTVFEENEKVNLISDYDLVIVSKTKSQPINLSDGTIEKLIDVYKMPGHPIYEIFNWEIGKLRTIPNSKFLFDFALAKCIFGQDVRHRLPIFKDKIPLTEGLRLLFNRVYGVLIPFSPAFFAIEPPIQSFRHLTFESVKLTIGSIEALLILKNMYSLTLKENINVFLGNLNTIFREVNDQIPTINHVINNAFYYKLGVNLNAEENALQTWLDSKKLCLIAFKLYMKELFDITPSSIDEMFQVFIDKNPNPLAFNVLIFSMLFKAKKTCFFKTLYKKPSNALLVARLNLLASPGEGGLIDNGLLQSSSDSIFKNFGLKIQSQCSLDLWESLKQFVIANYFDPFSPRRL